jgi:phage shock protein C
MYCTQCGVELSQDVRFCSNCGNRTANAPPPEVSREMPRALMLDKRNKKVAGVCAGFARYLGVDVVLIRVIFLAMVFCTGVGLCVYLAAWIIIPSDADPETRAIGARVPQTS